MLKLDVRFIVSLPMFKDVELQLDASQTFNQVSTLDFPQSLLGVVSVGLRIPGLSVGFRFT